MNDLRSRSRALAAVPDEDAEPSAPASTPPRVRPEDEERNGRRMSRRQSIAERARKLDAGDEAGQQALPVQNSESESTSESESVSARNDHMFRSSRPDELEIGLDEAEIDLRDAQDTGNTEDAENTKDAGPSSRPNRRREVAEDEELPEEDKFPWHFQFDDDEPEELQASSPLLSRAFRATIG